MREIVLDTETTGLSPDDGDRVVEIAAIELINGSITNNKFHVYINPERDMPDSAYRVHGISFEFLIDKPKFKDVVDEFIIFIGEDNIIAHNADFDLKFINAELTRIGFAMLDNSRVIDTLTMARRKHPGVSNSLDALCVRYGIDRSRRVKHGALIDSEILAEIYMELTGGRQASMTFSIQKEIRKLAPTKAPTFRAKPTGERLTNEEMVGHFKFVEESLGERALWGDYREIRSDVLAAGR
jgi:DNA polymerase-3 subunit epsilon